MVEFGRSFLDILVILRQQNQLAPQRLRDEFFVPACRQAGLFRKAERQKRDFSHFYHNGLLIFLSFGLVTCVYL